MTTDLFTVETIETTCVITFNRPDVHNAMNEMFITSLIAHLKTAEANNDMKVILIKANGKSFCAGADLQWMKKSIQFTETENIEDARALSQLMHTLYTLKKPTITLVQGATYGGGVGLVACSDIAIANTDAVFCFSEVKLGLIPAIISPYCVEAIGARQARRYFLSAELITAQKALALSLVHELVPNDALYETGMTIAKKMAHNAPNALMTMKGLTQRISQKCLDETIREKTMKLIAKTRTSAEAQEGMTAFFEKRKPNWSKS